MRLPPEIQRNLAAFLMSKTKKVVLRGSRQYTLWISVVLYRFVWKLIFH